MLLENLTWPEVKALNVADKIVLFPLGSFCHTGFTGTSLWVDPQRGTWVVLLSNRTYADGPNRMQALRRAVNDSVAIAVDLASD